MRLLLLFLLLFLSAQLPLQVALCKNLLTGAARDDGAGGEGADRAGAGMPGGLPGHLSLHCFRNVEFVAAPPTAPSTNKM